METVLELRARCPWLQTPSVTLARQFLHTRLCCSNTSSGEKEESSLANNMLSSFLLPERWKGEDWACPLVLTASAAEMREALSRSRHLLLQTASSSFSWQAKLESVLAADYGGCTVWSDDAGKALAYNDYVVPWCDKGHDENWPHIDYYHIQFILKECIPGERVEETSKKLVWGWRRLRAELLWPPWLHAELLASSGHEASSSRGQVCQNSADGRK